ncbi:MAG: flavodoxin domain-containing protein [Eubacterium sp.]
MKILIAYQSKNNTSKKSAELLSAQVGGDVDVVDLKNKIPEFDAYDIIIIGGSIRMGQYPRVLKKVLKKNTTVLLEKKVIYFINCAFTENREQYYKDNIPDILMNHTLGCFCFGGELNLATLKGTDRMVATAVARQSQGSGKPPVMLDERAIAQCADRIGAVLKNNRR